ncbi:hypothetical protein [Vulcanisaeta sp. JCM 14467]
MAERAVAAPFSIRNTRFQLRAEYAVSNALPTRYGIVNLSGGTSPSARIQPTAMNNRPSIPTIIVATIPA